MNIQNKLVVAQHILGNVALQERFFMYAEVLAHIVSRTSRPVSLGQLESDSDLPPVELKRLCNQLERAGILNKHPNLPEGWSLGKDPGTVTLEDVLRCVLAEGRRRGGSSREAGDRRFGGDHDLDLLLMQAAMAVDENIFKQLRTFSLDRLKVNATEAYSSNKPLRIGQFNEMDEAPHRFSYSFSEA